MQRVVRVVAVAIVRRSDRWLVAQRLSDAHLGGLWEFPGGGIEGREQPADAAVRELFEECAVVAKPVRVLAWRTHEYEDRRVQLAPVICEWLSGEGEAKGCARCDWVTLDEMTRLAMPALNQEILRELAQIVGEIAATSGVRSASGSIT